MHFLQHGPTATAAAAASSMAGEKFPDRRWPQKNFRKGIFYFVPKAETIPPLILFVSREGEIETKGKNDENKPKAETDADADAAETSEEHLFNQM